MDSRWLSDVSAFGARAAFEGGAMTKQTESESPENRRGGYTMIEHEILDSVAARLLTPGGRAALLDFLRLWMRESRNGQQEYIRAIWTWAGSCNWVLSRKAYGRYQREVVAKGFADALSPHSGHYRASNRWRSYSPSEEERARIERHASTQSARRTETRKYREARRSLAARGQERPIPPESKESTRPLVGSIKRLPETPNPQGTDNTQPTGSRKHPDPNTAVHTIPPPPPPSEKDSAAAPPTSSRPAPRFSLIDGELIQVWPIRLMKDPVKFKAYAESVYAAGHWTEEQRQNAARFYDVLEATVKTPHSTPRRGSDSLEGLSVEEAASVIAKGLGDTGPRALQRVRSVIQKYGVEPTRRGALDLYREKVGLDKAMKYLAARAEAHANAK